MSFLFDECSIYDLVNENDMNGFTCGDRDLDDFFSNDCFGVQIAVTAETAPQLLQRHQVLKPAIFVMEQKCWTCSGNRTYINPLTNKRVACPNCTNGWCSRCNGTGNI